ncbi:putative Adaptive-response sensory-kinase SasA [Pillotina sp. SPG140]
MLTSSAVCVVLYQHFSAALYADMHAWAEAYKPVPFEQLQGILSAIKSSDMRVTLVNPEGTVVYDNTVPPESLENHADRQEIRDAWEQGFGESKRFSGTLGMESSYYALRLDNGFVLRAAKTQHSIFFLFARAVPLIIAVVAVVIIVSNIAAGSLAHRMQHIAVQLEDLKKSEKMRREFSANVSHELKTPLTSISGYAEMLNNGMVREVDKASCIHKIQDESERLVALIEDMLLLSQLDEGKPDAAFETVDITAVAREAIEALAFKASDHDVAITVSGAPMYINVQVSLIRELFFNVIDNAIKYNKRGGKVTVEFRQKNKRVEATVTDTGIGIPRDVQARVFERFYRVDKSRSKKTGGTGLGLAIVKHIATIHNADIHLESAEGKGTRITVLFPEHHERQTPVVFRQIKE